MINSGIPKYLAIANTIIHRIQKNELPPGTKIPSENEIIKEYVVSNTTARKVLMEIERAGWVEKIRGKGTFVKDFVVDRAATKILGFTKNMKDQGLVPHTKLIDSNIIDHDVLTKVNGKTFVIQAPVFKLRRLRLANDVPMMHETRYISLVFCPEINKKSLEGSLYDIYQQEYFLNISEIAQDLSAIFLDDFSKRLLQVKKDIPGMKVDGVTFCGKDMILEIEESIYRGDKYKFGIKATP